MVKNAVLALMICALFVGACVLCFAGFGSATDAGSAFTGAGFAFGTVDFGLMVYVFLTVRKD